MRRVSAEEFSRTWRHLAEPVQVTVWGRPVAEFTPYVRLVPTAEADAEPLPSPVLGGPDAAPDAPHATIDASSARDEGRRRGRAGRDRGRAGRSAETPSRPPKGEPPGPAPSLGIGGVVEESHDEDGVRVIDSVRLDEVSLTVPADHPLAPDILARTREQVQRRQQQQADRDAVLRKMAKPERPRR